MKRKIIIFLILVSTISIFVVPSLILAQIPSDGGAEPQPDQVDYTDEAGEGNYSSTSGGLVPCDNSDANPCDINQFMNLINNVIHFILFYLAIPIAAIMFVYAGFLMVTSGGSTESRSKAKNIFTSAAIGLILAAAAWLIVKTLLSILGYTDTGMFFKL